MRSMIHRLRACLAVTAVMLGAPVLAGETFAITGATVHTMTERGTLAAATVLVEDGKISGVGEGLAVPAHATVFDATGRVVTPGLFDAASAIGLVEINLEASTVDFLQRGERFTAAFDVASAINPRSTLVAINRIEGVTRAMVAPASAPPDEAGLRSSILSGMGAVISLSGDSDYLTKAKAALFAELGSSGGAVAFGSRAEAMLRLQSALRDAADYGRHPDAYESGERRAYSVGTEDLLALQPVLAGQVPLVVRVNRASDILSTLALARNLGVRLVIAGGAEAWLVAGDLADAGVPVILDPYTNLPEDFDRLDSTLENAARLRESGVTIAFSTGNSHNARNMTQAAGNAVAHGLPWADGLRAITRAPAEIFGLADRIGAIETGLAADLVIWDGDPLEVTSFAERVFIDGVAVPMRSRQTLLRDRYLDWDGELPPAYRRPWSPNSP